MVSAFDVTVCGGPRDGAAMTYREFCFAIARGEMDGYLLSEHRNATGEEYLVAVHASWVQPEETSSYDDGDYDDDWP